MKSGSERPFSIPSRDRNRSTGVEAEPRETVAPRRRWKPSPIELLVILAIIAILIGLLLPALRKTRCCPYMRRCRSSLRQIGLACQLYADDNNEAFPDSLDMLVPDYLPDRKLLVCPRVKENGAPPPHHLIEPGLHAWMDGRLVLAYDGVAASLGIKNRRNAVFVDGHVECIREHEDDGLMSIILDQRAQRAAWEAAGRPRGFPWKLR